MAVVGLFAKILSRERAGDSQEEKPKYFTRWSPYRIRKVHVKFIGKKEIYRQTRTRAWRVSKVLGRCTVPLRERKYSNFRRVNHDGRSSKMAASWS